MRYLFYVLAILLPTGLAYFVSNNLIFTIIVGLSIFIYFIFIEYILRRKILIKNIKSNDLNYFLHDFILLYLDNKEIKFALKESTSKTSDYLKEELRTLDEYSGIAILTNLENYFSSSLYSLFLLAIKNKTNHLEDNLKFILDENMIEIKKKEDVNKRNQKALWEFSVLWLVSFIIFVILRLSLTNYFSKLQGSFYYLVGISIYFLLFFLSVNLFVFTYYKREKL